MNQYQVETSNDVRDIQIIVSKPIPQEIAEYIADCWVTFVTQDLGYMPSDLQMVLG